MHRRGQGKSGPHPVLSPVHPATCGSGSHIRPLGESLFWGNLVEVMALMVCSAHPKFPASFQFNQCHLVVQGRTGSPCPAHCAAQNLRGNASSCCVLSVPLTCQDSRCV